jgi:hypothetical protein
VLAGQHCSDQPSRHLQPVAVGELMGRRVWIALLLLFAAVFFRIARRLRQAYEDDEPWDIESERVLDQVLASAPAEKRREGRSTNPV